ncbi:MAG: hypothetical protein ACYTEQ_18190 [Planctomycetota bacterium]|jgi:hypothetical protein
MSGRDDTPHWANDLAKRLDRATGEFHTVAVNSATMAAKLEDVERRVEGVERGMGQVLAWMPVQDEKCGLVHHEVDQRLKEDRARIMAVEQTSHSAAVQRAGWIGGWKWLLGVVGVLVALFGAAVAVAKLL